MTRWLSSLFASAALAAASVPAHAQEGGGSDAAAASAGASSLQATLALAALSFVQRQEHGPAFVRVQPVRTVPGAQIGGRYGPFRVVGHDRVEMIGATDQATPAQFAALLRDFPGIRQIDMVECPGTHDDVANLKLGRMIRASGIATYVPANGSVRSGAVDLFLAGRERRIDNGAEFAVHSWRDRQGREARDFAPDARANRNYLDYYREMGMDARSATAFYAFTNSVPHSDARWLEAREMRAWLARTSGRSHRVPVRPVLASAAFAEPVTVTKIAALDPMVLRTGDHLALLDLSMLDRTALAGSHPAIGKLDLTRRL